MMMVTYTYNCIFLPLSFYNQPQQLNGMLSNIPWENTGMKTHPQASHGIKAITEDVTGVPEVFSLLMQHKGMTFQGVKHFLPS